MCCVKEQAQKTKRLGKKSDTKGKGKAKGKAAEGGGKRSNVIRIEHLNYKVCLLRQLPSSHVDHTPQ
jgi:hypothetical protein